MSTPARPEGLVLQRVAHRSAVNPRTEAMYDVLVEAITDAWAARAPRLLVREHLGE